MKRILPAFLPLLSVLAGPILAQRSYEPISHDPPALLARARDAMGFSAINARVVHYHAVTTSEQNYQSDRTYPPFFSAMSTQEIWFDPASGVLRVQSSSVFPGSGPSPVSTTLDDGANIQVQRGEQGVPVSRRQSTGRYLSAWAVIKDWSAAKDVRIVGTESYRDYPRVVLERETPEGTQRLYLDPKSGFPVKLDMIEPHYLWGQRHIEYIWSTWTMAGGVVLPGSAFRVADNEVEISQTMGAVDFLDATKAPALPAPPTPAQQPAQLPMYLQPIPPRTIQVTANTWLLTNPGYTEAVTFVGGEIYIFDATQGEDRARLDATAIAKLFPGQHKVNVIVTDLAWPHLAGVRYWVAQGTTIISHAAARQFIEKVINRRWTLAPDTLERQRRKDPASVKLRFIAADQPANHAPAGWLSAADQSSLTGRALWLIPIDGIGSEIALMVYLPNDKFLWASDYIQTLEEPSLYATEVLRAADRAGIEPERVAAEHLPLTDWKTVRTAQQPAAGK